MTQRPHLRALADRIGILPGFTDNTGAWCATSESVTERLLNHMGLDASSEVTALAALEGFDTQDQDQLIQPFVVEPFDPERLQTLSLSAGRSMRSGRLTTDTGDVEFSGQGRVELPISEPGWYRIEIVDSEGRSHFQERVVHPARCFTLNEALGPDTNCFGILANLYSLRSTSNASDIGDLGALAELVHLASEAHAGFVGINPLHAVAYERGETSPYCPDSRVFGNPAYISPPDVPEYEGCNPSAARLMQTDSGAGRLNYDEIWTTRLEIFRLLHAEFEATGGEERRIEFAKFCAAQGQVLNRYAEFMSTRLPSTTPALHRYLQFELNRQLGHIANGARNRNMPLGLYTDIAVGVAPAGADAHVFPDVFMRSLRVGAPPDAYAPEGQEWGVCPLRSAHFGSAVGTYWRAVLQAGMQHAGLVRIDHAMGLTRQFLIPEGEAPSRGAYLKFPTRELLGILALESHRHQTVVVGESLGTLPDGFLDQMQQAGMLTTPVTYFERDSSGSFRGSGSYRRDALAQLNTHDLPTLRGYVAGHDIEARAKMGLLDSVDVPSRKTGRREELAQLKHRLRDEGIAHDQVADGMHAFLGRTRSRLVGVMFDDLAGEIDAVNLPEAPARDYQPWTRRNMENVSEVLKSDAAQGMLRAVGRTNR